MTTGIINKPTGQLIVASNTYNFTEDVIKGSVKNHMEVEFDMVNGKITAIYGPDVKKPKIKKQKEEKKSSSKEFLTEEA